MASHDDQMSAPDVGRLFWVGWVVSAVLGVALAVTLIRVLWAIGTRLLP